VKKTLKGILAEYGVVAVVLYFAIFGMVLAGTYLAIRAGWTPKSAAGKTGTFVAAYVVTKLTQPIRIAVTVLLTPFFARVYERVTGRSARSNIFGAPSE
jgi:hypothetical protein